MRIDLHIHSSLSGYKENSEVVNDSTVENAEVLMQKLNEHCVGLFSITDHNRFNVELYERLDALIDSGDYPNVLGLAAGVEFDVKLDDEMNRCHVTAIFDAKNRPSDYRKIAAAINGDPLTQKDEFYNQTRFETLLKSIGLNVILIACQRSSLDKHEGHHNSLSESTTNAKGLIRVGYVDALEFHKHHVEGILRSELRYMQKVVPLITGSDCHEWTAYPNHDHTQQKEFRHTRVNIKPTFKGLLMAVTAPETRINTQENTNPTFIRSFTVNGKKHPLANGINAIIGENGSGKSTLLKMLGQHTSETFVKKLIADNGMSAESVSPSDILYIGQGDIVSDFKDNTLIDSRHYAPVDTDRFETAYKTFATGLLDYIHSRIRAKKAVNDMSNFTIAYSDATEAKNHFIIIDAPNDYSNVVNKHYQHVCELQKLIEAVQALKEDSYYSGFVDDLNSVLFTLQMIHKHISQQNSIVSLEQRVKHCILSCVKDYDIKTRRESSSIDKDIIDFQNKRRAFVERIVNAVRANVTCPAFPEPPAIVSGVSTRLAYGFKFNAEAHYHNRDVIDEFLSRMFLTNYASLEKLKSIDTPEAFTTAVKGIRSIDKAEQVYWSNFESFIREMCDCRRYIIDTASDDQEVGNTLGEMSLAYIKFIVQSKEQSVILIDQPEDHISNSNITSKLIAYLDSIRYKKQIIIVTHNPLLVVNQDADRVFYVSSKRHSPINVMGGCLEENVGTSSILGLVAEHMDGGRDAIERRLKVYGQEHNS